MTPRKPVPKAAPPNRDAVTGVIFLPVIAILLFVLPFPAWAIERVYSRNIYATFQSGLTSATNVIPLAILDLLIVGGIIDAGFRVSRLWRVMRAHGLFVAVWEGCQRVLRAAAIIVIVFMVFWGFNYRRVPLDEALNIPPSKPTRADLVGAIADANGLAIRLRQSPEAVRVRSYEEIAKDLNSPFNLALKKIGRPALLSPGRPKYSLVLTPYFTWAGISGMVDPFGLESIVHPDLLPVERPFVLAHEWAHLAGQNDEAEASAVGWFACMQGDPALAYSATLFLIMEAGASLPGDVWQQSESKLDPAVRADIDAIRKRMERERPEVRQSATRIYDKFLKVNQVPDGVASYSRALHLILANPFREAMATYSVRGR